MFDIFVDTKYAEGMPFIIVKNAIAKAKSGSADGMLAYSGTIGDCASIPPAQKYDNLHWCQDDCHTLNLELGDKLFFVVATGDSMQYYEAFSASRLAQTIRDVSSWTDISKNVQVIFIDKTTNLVFINNEEVRGYCVVTENDTTDVQWHLFNKKLLKFS